MTMRAENVSLVEKTTLPEVRLPARAGAVLGSMGRRVGLAALAALLHTLAFPPYDVGFLGAFELVPLAFAVRGLTARRAAALGWISGILGAHLVFRWLFCFAAFKVQHGLVLGGYVALFPALVAVALARWGFGPRGLLLVPAATAAIEWARGHAGFLAVPWVSLGQTQHANLPLLQLAAWGGEPLVGIVVVLANVVVVQAIAGWIEGRRVTGGGLRRFGPSLAGLGIVAAAHLAGGWRLARPIEGRAIVVAAVQPSILPDERDEEHAEEHFARLVRLSRDAHTSGAELVVWPETAVGNLEGDLVTKLAIRDVVEEIGAPIVFGSSKIEKLGAVSDRAPSPVNGRDPHPRAFNGAFLMEPRKPVADPYLKVRLVPFAEYRPIDLPESVAPRMFETERGRRHMTLESASVRVEPVICWENLFADEVRATASDEPSVIAHLVNDAWFGRTAQPELHNLVSAFRAAESDRPLVIASNTGPSGILDARGRIVARTAHAFAPAMVAATVTMPSGQTPYRRWGDWTWILPLALALATLRVAERRAA